MTRTDRLLSIVLALQARTWQRAEDLAALLGVSLRTIYRDMQALEATGVPLAAVPGKGYRLLAPLLPPLLFTTEEAVAVLLGSGHAARHLEERYQAAARAASTKVEAVLPEGLREEVATLREGMVSIPANVFDHPSEQVRLQQLRRALAGQRTVRFTYGSRSEGDGQPGAPAPTTAAACTLDPYGLVHQGGAWYVVGHCHATQAVRSFRLSRIDTLAVQPETFERPAGYRLRQGGDVPRELSVRVRFDATAARWIREAPPPSVAEMEELPGGLLVTLRVQREAEVLPWLLGWGAHALVLEPSSLRRRVAREAEQMAAQYRADLLLLA